MAKRTEKHSSVEQHRGHSRLNRLMLGGALVLAVGVACIIATIKSKVDGQLQNKAREVEPESKPVSRWPSVHSHNLEDHHPLADATEHIEANVFKDACDALLRAGNNRPELIYNALIDFLRFFHGEFSDPVDLEYSAVFGVDGSGPEDVGLAYLEGCGGDLQDFTKVLQIAIDNEDTRVATIVAAYIKRECYKERRENEDRITEESLADERACEEEGGFRSPREECDELIRVMQGEGMAGCGAAIAKSDAPYEEQVAGAVKFGACVGGAIDEAERQRKERCTGLSEESIHERCRREKDKKFNRAIVDAEKADGTCGQRTANELGVDYNAVFDLYATRRANEFFELYLKFSVLEASPEVADLERYIRLIQLIHNDNFNYKTGQQFVLNALGVADIEAFSRRYTGDVIAFLSGHCEVEDGYCQTIRRVLANYNFLWRRKSETVKAAGGTEGAP